MYFNGYQPDLRDPRDLSEKLLWLKLHDRSALHTQCADKIRVRDYVAAKVGTEVLVPVVRVTYDARDINSQTITAERFVVKTNHDQGGVFFCRDRASFDWEDVRRRVAQRLKINKYYEFREHQYKHIRRGVLVENLIDGQNGGSDVIELKVSCFHGRPQFVQAILGRFTTQRHAHYDLDWTRLPIYRRVPDLEYELPRPRELDRILAVSAALAAPFLFCRIDFLIDGTGRPWFSEITFHPAAGLVRYRPNETERALGDLLDLSRIDESRQMQRAVREANGKPRLSRPHSQGDEGA